MRRATTDFASRISHPPIQADSNPDLTAEYQSKTGIKPTRPGQPRTQVTTSPTPTFRLCSNERQPKNQHNLIYNKPPIVIAAGTTGGLARDINVGDIAVGVSAVYGQADATAFGYALGQIPRMPVDYSSSERAAARCDAPAGLVNHPVRVGRIVSSDSFCTEQVAEPMRQRFPDAMGADMETYAIAQVAWSCGVDWISLRAVSDLCGPGADQAFHMDGARAAAHSAQAVRAYLTLL